MKKLAILLTLVSVAGHAQDFKWLLGTWKENSGKSLEAWSANEKGMNGIGYRLMADGTKKVSEEMSVVKKGNEHYFVSDVEGPQQAIEFKITSHDKNSFVAENPNHDFPKKISYKKIDDSHFEAFISDGASKIIRFYFSKVND